jgi:hypothetical protein
VCLWVWCPGQIYPTPSKIWQGENESSRIAAIDRCSRDGCECLGGAARRASVFAHERSTWALDNDPQSSVTIDAGGFSKSSGDGIAFGALPFPAEGGGASAHFLRTQYDVLGLNYRDLRELVNTLAPFTSAPCMTSFAATSHCAVEDPPSLQPVCGPATL